LGFMIGAKVGTPPEYKVQIVSIGNDGLPSTSDYGGSAQYNWTPTNTNPEFIWFTLTTPATATPGDLVAIKISPNGTVPNTSNNTRVSYGEVMVSDYWLLPRIHRFTTGWSTTGGWSHWGIKYNDERVYGIPASGIQSIRITSETTPDEIGLRFSLPFTVSCVGATFGSTYLETNAACTIILYDNNDNILRSIDFEDVDKLQDNYGAMYGVDLYWNNPITLSGEGIYRLTYKMNSSGAGIYADVLAFQSSTVRTNNINDMWNGWYLTQRTDSGSWTDSMNKTLTMGIHIDGIEITTSGGGDGGGAYAYVS